VLLPSTFSRWLPGRALQERARELIARLGLPKPGQVVATLSRGEMQRTALARALLLRPRLLVADEPTASLDAQNERAVWEMLFESAKDDGVTLLVATHQKSIQAMTDRLITLDHGTVVSDETRGGEQP
jgi:putative ABC transport system ATP-binding protein